MIQGQPVCVDGQKSQAMMVAVDDEPYAGPNRFWYMVGSMLGGYVLLWVGLCLMAINYKSIVPLWVVLGGAGLVIAVVASVMLCVTMRPVHENDKCRVTIIVAVIISVVMATIFLIIVFTTSYQYQPDDHQWFTTGNGAARWWLVCTALAVVSIAGCVVGCFLGCVMNNLPTTRAVVSVGLIPDGRV
eukprot:TRINITY_DN2562_c0_g1_i1.p2 TRINITY_DN2562_c0_g1~~TRINITY_DN2562_c0_g1_i1.p2  ORF type:complete len:187 (+),score=28.55 TRINITY_DN2562_c0_g1_i1:120-680(+)